MAEIFVTSGENSDNVTVPRPILQSLFLPGIDNPFAIDGLGIVTPWGGGSTSRKYGDYGSSGDISSQNTQLNDLSSSFIPAEGPGLGTAYNFEGLVGPQGDPGKDGTTLIIHQWEGLNSNYLTALPHNIDQINDLGTAVDKLIYTDSYSSYGGLTWAERQPAGDVNKSWQSLASSINGGNLIAGNTLRLYVSDDSGATWTERQPAGAVNKNWQSVASDSDGSHLIAAVFSGRLYVSSNYGVSWSEIGFSSLTAEQYWGNQDGGWTLTDEGAQTFTTTGSYTLKQMALRLAKVASDTIVTVTIELYAVDGFSKPTGASLYTIGSLTESDLSTSLEWFQFSNLSYALSATTEYAVVVSQSISGGIKWDGESGYNDGIGWLYSTQAGDWVDSGKDFDFYCYSGTLGDTNTSCVASDSDGSNLIAGVFFGRLYTSDNGGTTWIERQPLGDTIAGWWCCASDSDGSNLIAGVFGGRLYVSDDSGATWTERQPAGAVNKNWQSVASDSDGSHLIASNSLRLYTSSDSGVNWTERQPAGAADIDWEGVASDSDGSNLIAVANGDRVYISTDSGVNWTEEQPAGASNQAWKCATSDGDGSNLAVGYSSGRLYTGASTTSYSEATWAESSLTSAGRAILDDATAADQATTLGLGVGDSPTWVGATLSDMMEGSVLFAGVGGLISQDNTNLFWNNSSNILVTSGLTVTGNSVFGLNSSVFQPATDSTTFFQVLDAAGAVVGSVDTVNKRWGIGTSVPTAELHIAGGTSVAAKALITSARSTGSAINIANMYAPNMTVGQTAIFSIGKREVTNERAAWSFTRASVGATDNYMSLSFHGGGLLFNVVADGNIGIGEIAPETLIEATHAQPYLTLHNSTHEDTDGGRESRLNFKGEQSGGEETTLARIEVGHDGVADDEKGYWDLYTNSGTDGDSPTKAIRVDSSQRVGLGMTPTRKFTVVENDSDGIFIRDNSGTNASTLGMGVNTTSGFSYIQSRADAAGTIQPLTLWVANIKVISIETDYTTKIGDGGTTNYTAIDATGNIVQYGTGRYIESSKSLRTSIGGYAVKLTNKTGANSVAGQLVDASTTTDDAVGLAGIGDVECFGVFLDSGIADGSEAWVVVSGIADVAFDDNVAAVHGNWVATGVAAGYARTSASPAAAPAHFEEIGHCIETVAAGGAGTHILARCLLHFN